MFQFPWFASCTYVFSTRYSAYAEWVPPFRDLWITVCLPTPQSLSQATTSFIASDCQGIHHMHLITWLYNPKQSLTHTSECYRCKLNCYYLLSVNLITIQLQSNSYTKTLDSVNLLVLNYILSNESSLNNLFQTQFSNLLMINYHLVGE